MLILRSVLFHIFFVTVTAVICVACLPGLFFSRAFALKIARLFVGTVYFLERHILGLDYEVRGREHLPDGGCYIVAAKHQSTYETFKLHSLFGDPAIILKQELLRIPLWGRYLQKVDPIAIDRSKGKSAMQQIISGALHIKEQGRPIVIFPQGTRVHTWQTVEDRPYKIGAIRMRDAIDVPLIPMATNSGAFWPRGGFLIGSGKVIFEFLPPLPPLKDEAKALATMEKQIEDRSIALLVEARQTAKCLPNQRQASKDQKS